MKFPVAYLCEAGFWRPTDAEVMGLRNYLLKGGFIIFDDFARNDWVNFTQQMQARLPRAASDAADAGGQGLRLVLPHHVAELHASVLRRCRRSSGGSTRTTIAPKRLMAVINYNNDISEYWEWSDEGFFPVDASNEAYKLGVNYLVYALTR